MVIMILVLYIWILHESLVNAAVPTRREILDKLLNSSRYDASIVPEFDEEFPTNVSLAVRILDIHTISESSMDYSVDLFLTQVWRDTRLDYQNTSAYHKLEIDTTLIDKVWLPDLFFPNEKRGSLHTVTSPNRLMHLFSNGTIVYGMRLAMTLSCSMRLEMYPFDRQVCPMAIQSIAYSKDNIDLMWMNPEPFSVIVDEVPQFDVQSRIADKEYHSYYGDVGEFASLKAEIMMSRKVGYYILQILLPSVFLVTLSWVSFWVDATAVPARVSLGVTCVLTMTTHSSGIKQTLPPVSYVKAMDVWMLTCLLFVFAALLEFAYVNVLQRLGAKRALQGTDNQDGVSTWEHNGKDSQDNKPSCFHICDSCRTATRTANNSNYKAKRVDNLSKIFFPMTFLLFLVVFTIVVVSHPGYHT